MHGRGHTPGPGPLGLLTKEGNSAAKTVRSSGLWALGRVTVCATASFFFFQAEDGIRDIGVTGVQTCALPILNIPAIRAEGFEADDTLATLSRRVPEGIELLIVTGDQDAMQLVDGRVKVLRTTRGVSETKAYGREEVIEDYGVTPEQIPDYKALVGDPSDNIPGVRGIGPKGAASLLREFGSVARIYENLDMISARGTREKLKAARESAFLSLELARMRFDVPVEFDPDRKSTRLNSSHANISYAVFCLKKKK